MREPTGNALVLTMTGGGVVAVAAEDVAMARMNWSRWIADCSSRHCTSALALAPGTPIMRCFDCGWVTERIVWPDHTDAIETLLAMRPDEKTRNWEPGETLEQLANENVQHGIIQAPARPDDPTCLSTFRTAAIDGGALRSMQALNPELVRAIGGR